MDRKKYIELAKEAENSGRFNDACKHMKAAILENAKLSKEEQAVFSKAYKGVINPYITSWRDPTAAKMREINSTQVVKISEEVVKLMQDYMLPNADTEKSKVFSLTMKGEYLQYMAEVTTGEIHKENAEVALMNYKAARDVANTELGPTDPVRLRLAERLSVLYHDILDSPDRACHEAKLAFDDAVAELDTLDEDSYKDSTAIMQELRDNLTRWTKSFEEDDE